MKPRNRAKYTGRREDGTFTLIPHAVQDSPNWKRLRGTAVKVLLALARQHNGINNGDLCAAYSVLRKRGIRSTDTLKRALRELRHFGMIELTRQGGRHWPSLYAVTWLAIDDCKGKLDVPATRVASGDWKIPREPLPAARKIAGAKSAPMWGEIRPNSLKKAA